MIHEKDTGNSHKELLLYPLNYLADAIDAKDPYTTGHMDRVARFSMRVLDELPEKADHDFREDLLVAAMLHDIGKVRVPINILLKPGRLLSNEFREMKLHPVHSVAVLREKELIDSIGPGIRSHHERLDGSGYPDGLSGESIPLAARIIAVADVFDALTSKRIYRKDQKAFSDEKAIKELERSAMQGALDRNMVEAFKASYHSGKILMARATSYAEMSNPLMTDSAGEERPPLMLASLALKTASMKNNSRKSKEFALSDLTYFTILLRLATFANMQGKPQEAIRYARKALSLCYRNPELKDRQSLILIEQAVALRELGKDFQAHTILQGIVSDSTEDSVNALSEMYLGQIMLDLGNTRAASRHIRKARQAARKMRKKLQAEQNRSPIGVVLKWWNPKRVELLEGKIDLLRACISHRIGLSSTLEEVKSVCERFEILCRHNEAAAAYTEWGRFLSDLGRFDEAIFLLERERDYAKAIGDAWGYSFRTCWLSETYARYGSVEVPGPTRSEYEKRALSLLKGLKAQAKANKRELAWTPHIDTCEALIYWLSRRTEKAGKLALSLRKKLRQTGQTGTWEPRIVTDFLVLACSSDSAGLARLADKVRTHRTAIREIEILSEALVLGISHDAERRARLGKLLRRLGGTCWLHRHSRYARLLDEISNDKGAR